MKIVENFNIKEKKTKDAAKSLDNLKMEGKTLLGLGVSEKEVYRYLKNIKDVKSIPADTLNVLDILNYKNLVLSEESVKYLEKKYK